VAKRKKERTTADFDIKNFTPCEWAQNFYDWANKKYFKYQLPYTCVGFYKEKDMDYYGCSFTPIKAKFVQHIALNPLFENWCKVIHTTILHEMVHVKLHGRGGHGHLFQKERRRLILMGAFDEFI
jgi:hypothetical protein